MVANNTKFLEIWNPKTPISGGIFLRGNNFFWPAFKAHGEIKEVSPLQRKKQEFTAEKPNNLKKRDKSP